MWSACVRLSQLSLNHQLTWKCLPRLLADKESGAADFLTRPVLSKPCKETAGPRMQTGSSVFGKTVTLGTF